MSSASPRANAANTGDRCTHNDGQTLVPEGPAEIRRIKSEICKTRPRENDRLRTGELAEDFAIRYYTRALIAQRAKVQQRQRRQ